MDIQITFLPLRQDLTYVNINRGIDGFRRFPAVVRLFGFLAVFAAPREECDETSNKQKF